jgi:hypothetical protein
MNIACVQICVRGGNPSARAWRKRFAELAAVIRGRGWFWQAQAIGRKLWKSYAAARRRVLLILSFILRRPRCRERMPAPSMPLVMMP